MTAIDVVVTFLPTLPGNVPAIWIKHDDRLVLYLREGMTEAMADHFRVMAVRHAMPGVDFDTFTVTAPPSNDATVAPFIA